MKTIRTLFWALFALSGFAFLAWNNPAFADEGAGKAQLKQVCKEKVDKKGNAVKDKKGNVVQDCKTIKVHKKLEGTEIPVKK